MMGPTHAVSGTAAWLAASAVAETAFDYHQSSAAIAVGAIACTGAALLPDLDTSGAVLKNKGGATVARTFGVVSLFVAECVEKFSLGVYKVTRSKKDGKRHNGHRTFTHTWIFAALLGTGTGFLAGHFGKPAVISILFILTGLAIRGLMNDWAKKQGWWIVTLLSLGCAFGLYQLLPPGKSYVTIGAAVGIGCVVHTFGDMITRAGCPVLWPLPIKKERWFEIGLPDSIAIRAGSKIEQKFLIPLFFTVAVAAIFFLMPEARGMVAAWVS
ncbi:metal-dependent hydrolase [Stackebrandtia sp.]|uniref:metal-dependent hydrolase n=1 Tax=Stackebrandtia sp. TaxID=2023065 RepID=UPI0039C946D9